MSEKMMHIELCVGDHVQNGFCYLAQWSKADESTCRAALDAVDEMIDPEAEPDHKTEDYTFLLDLWDGPNNCVDNNKRNLPLQIAMRIAPDQVREWLEKRPDPDSPEMLIRVPPLLTGQPLAPAHEEMEG